MGLRRLRSGTVFIVMLILMMSMVTISLIVGPSVATEGCTFDEMLDVKYGAQGYVKGRCFTRQDVIEYLMHCDGIPYLKSSWASSIPDYYHWSNERLWTEIGRVDNCK